MTKLKLLELFDNLKVIVSDDGKIHTINHTNTRCNGLCDNNIQALRLSNEKRSIQIVFDNVLYPSIKDASRKTNKSEYFIKKYGKEVVSNE